MIGRQRQRTRPPPGKTRVSDWAGLRVRTVREMRNGWTVVPAGTVALVDDAGGGVGISITTEPCAHCGVRVIMSRVGHDDVEVMP